MFENAKKVIKEANILKVRFKLFSDMLVLESIHFSREIVNSIKELGYRITF